MRHDACPFCPTALGGRQAFPLGSHRCDQATLWLGNLNKHTNREYVVRSIFRDYAAGISPRAIARKLNRKGVPGPSGRLWRDTTIRGHVTRGTGILNNELYVGRLVWNRPTYLKDPKTGRRRSRLNPPELWILHEVPALRVVDNDVWDTVKARKLRDVNL